MNEQREHGPPSTSGRVPRHSVFLSERKTSVSLEEPFWQALILEHLESSPGKGFTRWLFPTRAPAAARG